VASIISHSPEETFAYGQRLAASLQKGDVLALSGELGAGKTHLVKGLAAGLGLESEVTSPTFTLVHEYTSGRLLLFHIDLYRLESPDEALKIGLDEYLDSPGVTVIEWADKFEELIPPGARRVRLRILDGDRREIEVTMNR